jgi:hypothetical protein
METKLDKTSFEKLINQRAKKIYDERCNALNDLINNFLRVNSLMNIYGKSSQTATAWQIEREIEKILNAKKDEIIQLIEKNEIEKILNNLNDVRFLFEGNHD